MIVRSVIVILLISFRISAQTGNLEGLVTDGDDAIPSVNIVLLDTRWGTASDEKGYYKLTGIPTGTYSVKFSAVGFESKTIRVIIPENKTLKQDVVLLPVAIEVETVEVTGFKEQEQSDTRTSVINLDPRNAKILPGAVEDVFRTLQSLPGVLAPNDFSSQLIVRGSGPDQNLIIMDDVEIFNPYRLYGVISMFNPDAVSDVNLISGGFPARYGDRLSAVLDVTNREGTKNKYLSGNINASIVDANIVLEGKNPFNLKGSWLFNSRRTYYDLIIEPFVKNAGLVDDNTSFPNFFDFQTKIAIGPYNGHKFLFNGIYSRDGVDIVSGNDRNTPDSVDIFNVTRNDIISGAWHYAPSEKLLNKVIISWYRNSGETDFSSSLLDPALNRSKFEDVVPDTLAPYLINLNFTADFSYTKYTIDDKFTYIWNDHIFEAGAGVDFMETVMNFRFDLDPEIRALFASNPQFRAALSNVIDKQDYKRYRLYAQNNFKVTDKFYFHPGLRFDYYEILHKSYLAPRVALSYAIDNLTTLRGVWGIYFQSPGYEKLRDSGFLYDFSDEYTSQLDAEQAIHYVLGIERWLSAEWSLRFETYYKDFTDLFVQQSVPGLTYFTERVPGKDFRYPSGWTRPVPLPSDSLTQIPENGAYGESYGFEILLAKKNILANSPLSGWISYALAYADIYEKGIKYPFRFDQRHTVNIVLNYKVNSWLEIGARWQFGSGFPYSEPVGIKPRIILIDDDLDGNPETPVIATRNIQGDPNAPEEVVFDIDFGNRKLNARKPVYHRLDIRINALADYWGLDWTFYLDVINVYNRSNVIGYDYFINDDLTVGREPTNMFPILPTLGFSVRF